MVFFTADTHFDHKNIIQYCHRPFSDVEQMNEVMIARWNEVVGREDTVFHLGDFAMRRHEYFLRRLNGHLHLIIGSHDDALRRLRGYLAEATKLKEVDIEGQRVVMCHYALRVWPASHYGAWLLYGHSHGNLPPIGKAWDVGVDVNDFQPLSWVQIKEIMARRPANDDIISPERGGLVRERGTFVARRVESSVPRLTR